MNITPVNYNNSTPKNNSRTNLNFGMRLIIEPKLEASLNTRPLILRNLERALQKLNLCEKPSGNPVQLTSVSQDARTFVFNDTDLLLRNIVGAEVKRSPMSYYLAPGETLSEMLKQVKKIYEQTRRMKGITSKGKEFLQVKKEEKTTIPKKMDAKNEFAKNISTETIKRLKAYLDAAYSKKAKATAKNAV